MSLPIGLEKKTVQTVQKRHEEMVGNRKINLDMNLLRLKNVNQQQTTTFSRC